MLTSIDCAIVCIRKNSDFSIVGTGFLIAPNHIATCAHVVKDALGKKDQLS